MLGTTLIMRNHLKKLKKDQYTKNLWNSKTDHLSANIQENHLLVYWKKMAPIRNNCKNYSIRIYI